MRNATRFGFLANESCMEPRASWLSNHSNHRPTVLRTDSVHSTSSGLVVPRRTGTRPIAFDVLDSSHLILRQSDCRTQQSSAAYFGSTCATLVSNPTVSSCPTPSHDMSASTLAPGSSRRSSSTISTSYSRARRRSWLRRAKVIPVT